MEFLFDVWTVLITLNSLNIDQIFQVIPEGSESVFNRTLTDFVLLLSIPVGCSPEVLSFIESHGEVTAGCFCTTGSGLLASAACKLFQWKSEYYNLNCSVH